MMMGRRGEVVVSWVLPACLSSHLGLEQVPPLVTTPTPPTQTSEFYDFLNSVEI